MSASTAAKIVATVCIGCLKVGTSYTTEFGVPLGVFTGSKFDCSQNPYFSMLTFAHFIKDDSVTRVPAQDRPFQRNKFIEILAPGTCPTKTNCPDCNAPSTWTYTPPEMK